MECPCDSCKLRSECLKNPNANIYQRCKDIQAQHINSGAWFMMNLLNTIFKINVEPCNKFIDWLKLEGLIDYPDDEVLHRGEDGEYIPED
jgi:hypothetical protein